MAKIAQFTRNYLPPWCVHGIQNTGRETLVVLICTSPPNP